MLRRLYAMLRVALLPLAFLLLTASASPCFSQEAPSPPPPPPPPSTDPATILSDKAFGLPVVAVLPGGWAPDSDDTAAAGSTRAEDTGAILTLLQDIADRISVQDQNTGSQVPPVIPYALRGTWVLAPETREDLNPDLARMGPFDIRSRSMLLADLLRSLTPAQLRQVGSRAGLSVTGLPSAQRALLERAFRPPLDVMPILRDPTGDFRQDADNPKRLTEPIDWSAVRIRARIECTDLLLYSPNERGMADLSHGLEPNAWAIDLGSHDYAEGADWRGLRLSAYSEVPNVLRPSDLNGQDYLQPVGMRGFFQLPSLLKEISSRTGLKLAVDRGFAERTVFLGSVTIPCGDVLEAMALGLTGAWRKLGDTFILAWDRRGIAAVQRVANERLASPIATFQRDTVVPGEMRNRRFILALPFDPSDPLALTAGQRERLTREVIRDEDIVETDHFVMTGFITRGGIPFADLLPGQQRYLRKKISSVPLEINRPSNGQGSNGYTVTAPDGSNGSFAERHMETSERRLTEADLQSFRLLGDVNVRVTLDLPGYGPVSVRSPENKGALYDYRPEDPYEPFRASASSGMESWAVPAEERGIVVPVLPSSRLSVLADEMERAGLNTLFYPVLYGGYATFPSAAFPLHPSLEGADGWDAAVRVMKPKGIRVVGYTHVLAWQEAGDRKPWLQRHPDWLDVDVLGRSRLDWLAGLDRGQAGIFLRRGNVRNYVRASEKGVEDKLRTLIAELSARRESAGLALAEWAPLALFPHGAHLPAPGLGYAVPDRLAASRAESDRYSPIGRFLSSDPVDIIPPESLVRPPRALRDSGDFALLRPDTHVRLLARLIEYARSRRPDWRTYVLDEPNGMDLPAPGTMVGGSEPMVQGQDTTGTQANPPVTSESSGDRAVRFAPDIVISPCGVEPEGQAVGCLLTILPREAMASRGWPDDLTSLLRRMTALQTEVLACPDMRQGPVRDGRWPAVVLDFRLAPGEISESLGWVRAPEKEPARRDQPDATSEDTGK